MPCSVISITLKIATSSLEIQYYSVMHQDAIDMKDYNTSESNQNKMVRSHSVYFIHYNSIGTTARLSVRSDDHRAMVRSSQNIYLFFYANFNIVFLTKHILEKNTNT
jgi:hypothetical protein